nr:T9SS type A sorting domain-containing protein [uncultured Flavobacterium sp.]
MKAFFTICVYFLTLFSVCGQAPQISYATPNVFTVNETIAPLLPNNNGGTIPNQPVVSTFAGTGIIGAADALGTAASFYFPTVVTLDLQGNSIVVDRSNHKIRKISPEGTVTTIAGTGAIGSLSGPGNAATFKYPDGAVVDSQGNIFISDQSNHKIRKIDTNGMVSTFAGSGTAGFLDGTGTVARFYYPAGMAVDANDNLYVADYSNHRIRKITPDGIVTTYAGLAAAGNSDGNTSIARFNGPTGVCVDNSGNVYVADYGNHKIRKIDALGQVTTFAGSGVSGATDGFGTSASFYHPAIIAVAPNSNFYVTDEGNNKIRKINTTGEVTTFAGTGTAGANDDLASAASFRGPTGVAVSSDKLVYVADYANHKIRKIATYEYTVVPDLPSGLNLNPVTGEISGIPTQITAPAEYTITATNQYGNSSFVVNIEVTQILANSSLNLNGLKAYPNPVCDKLHISGMEKIISIVVYTNLGKEIKHIDIESTNPSIDFSTFPSGIYLLKITTGSGMQELSVIKE